MRKVRNLILIAVLLALTVPGMSIVKVYAYPVAQAADCTSIVVDKANLLGSNMSGVEETGLAVAKTTGNQVYVRTFDDVSDGNVGPSVKNIEAQCTNWRGIDGEGTVGNLLVIALSTNHGHKPRGVMIYVGPLWTSLTDQVRLRIQNEVMAPKMGGGDVPGGVIDGLKATEQLMLNQLHPPTAAPQPQVPVIVTPPSPPPDLSWIGTVFMWLLIIAAALVLLVLFSKYQEKQAKVRAARQKARVSKEAASSAITEWGDKLSPVQFDRKLLEGTISAEDLESVDTLLKQADQEYNQAVMQFGAHDQSAGDPDATGLTTDEYAVIEDAYSDVVSTMESAETKLKEADDKMQSLKSLVEQSPKAVAAAGSKMTEAQNRIAAIKQQGYDIEEPMVTLAQARAALEKSQQALTEKRLNDAMENATSATEQAQNAAQLAESYPTLVVSLKKLHNDLTQRVDQVKQAVRKGRTVFEQISSEYAESSWKSIRGNGTEAEKRITQALQILDNASAQFSMEKQNWKEAQSLLNSAEKMLDEAEGLMRSITALQANLVAAKRDAAHEVDAAAADLDQARKYIHQYDADIRDSLEDDLDTDQKLVDQARAELAKKLPDYLEIVQLAKQATTTADSILKMAQSEHETAERLRRRAVSSLRDAKAAISQAREYIEDHSDDISSSAKKQLRSAQRELDAVEQMRSIEERIVRAQNAEQLANNAYSHAQSEFEEEERRRRRRREEESSSSTTVITGSSGWGSSSSSSDYSSSSGSGISSGWGSSSGGGISSSFGGSSGSGVSSGW